MDQLLSPSGIIAVIVALAIFNVGGLGDLFNEILIGGASSPSDGSIQVIYNETINETVNLTESNVTEINQDITSTNGLLDDELGNSDLDLGDLLKT